MTQSQTVKLTKLWHSLILGSALFAGIGFPGVGAPDALAAPKSPKKSQTSSSTAATEPQKEIAASPRSIPSKQSSFEQARTSYRKLLTQDANVNDLVAWERMATRILRTVEISPKASYAPEAYALLGQLHDRIYSKRNFHSGLLKAVYFYERLAKDFQGNDLVPEALLRLGDLRRNGLKDEPAARSAYYEILDVYPKSNLVAEAKLRLGITEETSVVADSAPSNKKNIEVSDDSFPEVTPPPFPSDAGGLFALFSGKNESSQSATKEIYSQPNVLKRPIIVIDPGHGGDELGAVGVDGVLEKDVVLQIAQYLEELLQERLRAKTFLTRNEDRTLALADRTKIANDQQADLFISIHANASEYKTAKGIETYYLDNTDDKSSLKLASRENASLVEKGNDLGFIISDFIQSAKLEESISFAHHVNDELLNNLMRYYKGVKNLGVKKAPFYVLVGAHMPCVLVEVSFIDHPDEGARLITKRYQRLAAVGIYEGIRRYFEQQGK